MAVLKMYGEQLPSASLAADGDMDDGPPSQPATATAVPKPLRLECL